MKRFLDHFFYIGVSVQAPRRLLCFAFWAWRLLQWPAMCKDPVRKYGLSQVRNSRPFLSRASAKTAKKNAMSPTRITQCLKEQMFTSAWNWTIPVTRVREDCAESFLYLIIIIIIIIKKNNNNKINTTPPPHYTKIKKITNTRINKDIDRRIC